MTARPCVDCGEVITEGTRCTECPPPEVKGTAHQRGYDSRWTRLSRRARTMQPFCLTCGTTDDLQLDHTPQAWARKANSQSVRLEDCAVLCGPCNRAAGAARGEHNTRGDESGRHAVRPPEKADFQSLSIPVGFSCHGYPVSWREGHHYMEPVDLFSETFAQAENAGNPALVNSVADEQRAPRANRVEGSHRPVLSLVINSPPRLRDITIAGCKHFLSAIGQGDGDGDSFLTHAGSMT